MLLVTTVYPQIHSQCGLQQISQLVVVGGEMSRGLRHSDICLLIRQINKEWQLPGSVVT